MNNRKQQKATLLPEVNGQTGLTPIQERAAILLATGKSFTNVADELSLNKICQVLQAIFGYFQKNAYLCNT